MHTRTFRPSDDRGIAMITTLLVMMLMSALLVGFTAVVMSDQRYRFIDRDRNQAFYAASAGIEKMTADLGNLFLSHVAPSATQVTALTATGRKPVIDDVTYTAPTAAQTIPTSSLTKCVSPNTIAGVGADGYTVKFCAAASGNPTTTTTSPIKTGPYEGLIALQMPFQVDVTAKTKSAGDVHLVRTMEAVAIPVFQFGIFSDVDLSFFAGPNFNFGGRVHTNRNLFLSEGSGSTLTLTDKVTAVKEIIRQKMQNGASIDTAPAHAGIVNMAQSPGVFRNLLRTEGSLVDGIGSSPNEPLWHTTSLSSYNSWIRNGRTGAKPLNLALVTVGGSNPDLIRRPPSDEMTANPVLFSERLFGKASLRILLSDTAADITDLPTVTATPPVQLDGGWRTTPVNNGLGTYTFDASHPPIARSEALVTALITTGNTAGTGKALTVAAGVPAYFKLPVTITVNRIKAPAATYTLTCTGKGAGTSAATTSFTGCTTATGNPLVVWNEVPAPTVTATVPTIDGDVTATTSMTASWAATGAGAAFTLQVANTMAFSPHSFWVNGNLVTCYGYTATTFTNCTLLFDIPNNATLTTSSRSTAGTGTIGGFLKIERQSTAGVWTDVTMEILNYGIADASPGGGGGMGTACVDPNQQNAIIKLQRRRDNNWAACPPFHNVSTDYWPNVLFDTREGLVRDVSPGGLSVPLGGVMHYITIDIANVSRWFRATAPYGASSGVDSKLDNGGYTIYFSDRRNNRNALSRETGDYGWEDIVNPASGTGAPNAAIDVGEDTNGNATLDVYGSMPNYNGVYNSAPPGPSAPLTAASRPWTMVTRGDAQANRAILFRHALKLTNGSNIAGLGVTGLTVVSENPVYVAGDWNSIGGNFTGAHAATAVMADAVTLLSNEWNDVRSFLSPYTMTNRNRATQTWYRLAIISGKGMAFDQPAGTATDFGTDGGAHNFLRYLENGNFAVNYRGSMATFFYGRQALGTFKCCATVYGAPQRNYAFDTDFLNPALLPPNTPMFRDLNTVGFAQEMRPGR